MLSYWKRYFVEQIEMKCNLPLKNTAKLNGISLFDVPSSSLEVFIYYIGFLTHNIEEGYR